MRRTIALLWPVARTLGRVSAAAVLLLLLVDCRDIFRPPESSQMTVEGRAGTEQEVQQDPVDVSLALMNPEEFGIFAGAAHGTVAGLGATGFAQIGLQGTDTEGNATSELNLCFTATEAGQPDVFLSQQHRLEVNCPPGAGGVILEAGITLTKNDQPLLVILDGTASIQCGDASVTNSGLPPFGTSIPVRHQSAGFDQIPDAFSVASGDRVKMNVRVHARGTSPGPSPNIEVTSTVSPGFDFGLEPTDCTPDECSDLVPCLDNPNGFCDDGVCRDVHFAEQANFSGSITPNPPTPNQLVSVGIQYDVQEGDLMPLGASFVLPSTVATIPAFSAGQVPGHCRVGDLDFLIVASGPSSFVVQTPGDDDPTITLEENGSGDTVVSVSFPFDSDVLTIPGDATITCSLLNAVVYVGDGSITGEILSIDPTSPDGTPDGVAPAQIELPIELIVQNAELSMIQQQCATDSDMDGTSDCFDDCPNDPQKLEPGFCGCGVPEVNTDGDLKPDCVDECPEDPFKTEAGRCGCGVPENSESDGDGDEVPDCDDGCPMDPAKTEPGECGCGVSEAVHRTACETEQQGLCKPGTNICFEGQVLCLPNVQPVPEQCNDVDDDCDGGIDEGNPGGGAPCRTGLQGACSDGFELCVDASIECEPLREPSAEVCNGIDDDCNGFTDEGNPCPEPESVTGLLKLGDFKFVGTTVVVTAAPYDPQTEGVVLRLEQGGSTVVDVQIPAGEGWVFKDTKKGEKYVFTDRKDGSLGAPSKDGAIVKCDEKKGTCSVKVTAKEVDVEAVGPGVITTTLVLGDDRFQQSQDWEEKAKGKKLVAK